MTQIPQEIIRELLINSVKFSYQSYNHKKAFDEIKAIEAANGTVAYDPNNLNWNSSTSSRGVRDVKQSSWGIPSEFKLKHEVWRVGKVWNLEFDNKGNINRVKIGRVRMYQKTFYITDFGVTVKPILFKSDDKYDLIKFGLAVEDKL